jgi:hypothetical protein
MRTIMLAELAILVAASACGSAQGATTDPGTGSTFAYSSRQQVKCNTATMQPDATQVTASCAGAEDLPLAGSCSDPGPSPHSAILVVNEPSGWEGGGAAAGWTCAWASEGLAVHVPNAKATMCCVVKSR